MWIEVCADLLDIWVFADSWVMTACLRNPGYAYLVHMPATAGTRHLFPYNLTFSLIGEVMFLQTNSLFADWFYIYSLDGWIHLTYPLTFSRQGQSLWKPKALDRWSHLLSPFTIPCCGLDVKYAPQKLEHLVPASGPSLEGCRPFGRRTS